MNEEVSRSAGKILVQLTTVVILAVVSVQVQRAVAKPDFGRLFMMKRVWMMKRFADGQAIMWQNIAGNMANKYNALKP